MTAEEIEALREKLNKIECIQSVIKSMQRNIESHERVFAGKEISIQNHTDKTNPIYITGKTKDKILRLLNEESEEMMNTHIKKLDELQ